MFMKFKTFGELFNKHSPAIGAVEINGQLYPRVLNKDVQTNKGIIKRQFRSWVRTRKSREGEMDSYWTFSSEVFPDVSINELSPITLEGKGIVVEGLPVIFRDATYSTLAVSESP